MQGKSFHVSIFSGIKLITEGETSGEFYFYTLPTSTPSDLKCEATTDDLIVTWSDPTTGMDQNTIYQYSYYLIDSNIYQVTQGVIL